MTTGLPKEDQGCRKTCPLRSFFMWPMAGGSLGKAQTRSTVSIRAWISFRVRRVTNPELQFE